VTGRASIAPVGSGINLPTPGQERPLRPNDLPDALRLSPQSLRCDSWHSDLDKFKLPQSFGWTWLARRKSISLGPPRTPKGHGLRTSHLDVRGTEAQHDGSVKVFGIIALDGNDWTRGYHRDRDERRPRLPFAEFGFASGRFSPALKFGCSSPPLRDPCLPSLVGIDRHIGKIYIFLKDSTTESIFEWVTLVRKDLSALLI
jgi:hypothetical protein